MCVRVVVLNHVNHDKCVYVFMHAFALQYESSQHTHILTHVHAQMGHQTLQLATQVMRAHTDERARTYTHQ